MEYHSSAEFTSFLKREIISALHWPPSQEKRELKSAQHCPRRQKNARSDWLQHARPSLDLSSWMAFLSFSRQQILFFHLFTPLASRTPHRLQPLLCTHIPGYRSTVLFSLFRMTIICDTWLLCAGREVLEKSGSFIHPDKDREKSGSLLNREIFLPVQKFWLYFIYALQ